MNKKFSKNISISMFDRNSISEIMMKEKDDGAAVIGVWLSMATLAFADTDSCVRLTPTIAMDENTIAEYFRIPEKLVKKAINWLKRLKKLAVVDGYLKFVTGCKNKVAITPERQEHLNKLNRQRVARYRDKQRKERENGANIESCNGCNGTVMEDVMDGVMPPVMPSLNTTEKDTRTPMETEVEHVAPDKCNASVMAMVPQEKRKNQRKENNNIYTSSAYSLPLAVCKEKETVVMHCEIQSEQTEVTKTHTPSKQDCIQEFSTVDNNDSLPLEKETSPLRKIIDAWNRLHLTPFNGRNPALPGKISTLLSQYSLETILQTIASITKSQFLLGKKGNSRWCITFEWLLNPANFAKVLSGKYLDKTRNNCQNTDSSYGSEMWRPGQQLPFFLPGEGEESMSPAETEKGLASLFRPITQQQKEAAKLLGLPA